MFSLERPAPAGHGALRCHFSGTLNDKLRGFYRSTFVDSGGTTRTIATTQMESTDARRAFPCWDEPDRKAVFEITLVVDEALAAYSNSPIAEETVAGAGRRAVRFAPTMVMSSYLVALIVGPLEATEPRDVDGVPVSGWCTSPARRDLTGFALDVAEHALRFFSDYFAIPYPADKLDLVAIPDFAFGAMENLGCVTFRETALLVDDASAARSDLERVADVVAHEIAHMWFGDLVTMRWWEGIWLNEAFATFMEVLCVDAFRPSWERWVSFGLEREAALAVDGLHSTRPIEYPVGSPEDADGMFDVLTYQKGGSVLRMLEQYLGRRGLPRRRPPLPRGPRLRQHGDRGPLGRARVGERQAGPVGHGHLDPPGRPPGRLGRAASTLTQEPFAYGSRSRPTSAIGERWRCRCSCAPLERRRDPSGSCSRRRRPPQPAVPGHLVVNAGGWGVYRVALRRRATSSTWAGTWASSAALERANLFGDTWALVLAGHAPLSAFLALAAALGDDDRAGHLHHRRRRPRPVRPGRRRRGPPRPWPRRPGRCSGPAAAALGWEPVAGEGERIPSLRSVLLVAPSARSVGTRPSARGGRDALRRRAGRWRPARRQPRVGGARRGGRPDAPGRLRRLLRPLPVRDRRPRRSSAT